MDLSKIASIFLSSKIVLITIYKNSNIKHLVVREWQYNKNFTKKQRLRDVAFLNHRFKVKLYKETGQEKLAELISNIYSSSSADDFFNWFYSCFMQVTGSFAPIKDYSRVKKNQNGLTKKFKIDFLNETMHTK